MSRAYEKQRVEKPIIAMLNMADFKVFCANSGKVRVDNRFFSGTPAGTSDIIGCAPDGRFVAIECKYGDNKPTAIQLRFIEEMADRGAIAFWTNSTEDCLEKLQHFGLTLER